MKTTVLEILVHALHDSGLAECEAQAYDPAGSHTYELTAAGDIVTYLGKAGLTIAKKRSDSGLRTALVRGLMTLETGSVPEEATPGFPPQDS